MSYQSVMYSAKLASGELPEARGSGYLPAKAVLEWMVAVVLLVLTAPLIAVLAILVKATSPGPAFYSQTRLGRYGRPYQIYKLRSMKHNCEATTGAVWSTGNGDARVTRVGRLLRDTHLDELPQLWNVLTGDMSLIGPRPERPEIVAKIERMLPRYRERMLVRPGVTGLAQMKLPPDTSLESVRRKLAYDLYYVKHVSVGMDLRITLCTGLHFAGAAAQAVCDGLIKGDSPAVEEGMVLDVAQVMPMAAGGQGEASLRSA